MQFYREKSFQQSDSNVILLEFRISPASPKQFFAEDEFRRNIVFTERNFAERNFTENEVRRKKLRRK